MKELTVEPIQQQAWFKQIQNDISKTKRPMDKMSIAEIRKLYQDKKFLCDVCSKQFDKCDYTLEEHVIHMINPNYLWSCEDCIQKDLRSGSIVGVSGESEPEQWQLENK